MYSRLREPYLSSTRKLMPELFQSGSDPYAFVEFADHVAASAALTALNQRLFLGKVSIYGFFSPRDLSDLLITVLARFVFAAPPKQRRIRSYPRQIAGSRSVK